ncbi:MAG: 50S ribosomal protein L11 methyltransferase [Bryobacterales bacterium]|nr:50S ribosomal protein L11 methyltransferase [Bryobacteraceae bacterium]MDW8355537.1 50S ribosomal protein L11 methyltransferase [Bryobacterales bacterium]
MTQWRLTVECPRSEKDFIVADVAEAGAQGVLEEDLPAGQCRLIAYFSEPSAAEAAAARWAAVLAPEPERNWLLVAQQQWRPLRVGRHFFLAPEWSCEPTPPGCIRLLMRSGLAAGSGWHPATQLALEALEDVLRPGDVVLDLGTGSGILATAASRLGAGTVFACDIDPEAARAAQQNFARDGVAVSVFVGSVRSVRSGSLDLLVANLDAAALHSLSREIPRVLASGGRAILCGFSTEQASAMCRLFSSKGLHTFPQSRRGDWACLVLAAR